MKDLKSWREEAWGMEEEAWRTACGSWFQADGPSLDKDTNRSWKDGIQESYLSEEEQSYRESV